MAKRATKRKTEVRGRGRAAPGTITTRSRPSPSDIKLARANEPRVLRKVRSVPDALRKVGAISKHERVGGRRDMYGFLTPPMPLEEGGAALALPSGLSAGRPVGDIAGDWRFSSSVQTTLVKRPGALSKQWMDMLALIEDADPQLSQAMWQWLRLCNNGHEATAEVKVPVVSNEGQTTLIDQQDPVGQTIVDELAQRVGQLFGPGGMDQLAVVAFRSLLHEGALALEIEISDDLKDIVDFHIVDPKRLSWVNHTDPDGQIRKRLAVYDFHTNQFEIVSRDQVQFLALDPSFSNLYGHAPFIAAVQAIYFKAQMLRDVRMVMHVSGHPRIDIKVLMEKAIANAPAVLKAQGNEVALKTWLQAHLDDVKNAYQKLEPDDGFAHWNFIEAQYIGPGAGGSVNVEQIGRVLNQQIASAVKMLPMLLGMNETATETHGTVQWQVQVAGIEAFQGIVARMFQWAYGQALEFYGATSRAHFHFNKHRVVDEMVEATKQQVLAGFYTLSRDNGWISDDEAAQALFNHAAVGPNPQVVALQQQVDDLTNVLAQQTATTASGGTTAQDQQTIKAAEAAAAKIAKKPVTSPYTKEEMERLRRIVVDFVRNHRNRQQLLADLVRFHTAREQTDDEKMVELTKKYEQGAKMAFMDLLPDLKATLTDAGVIK